jgi:hypothetical protein
VVCAIFLITEILQDTQAWHDWRERGIGTTDARAVRIDRNGDQNLLRLKPAKEEELGFQSPAMTQSKDLESEACAA